MSLLAVAMARARDRGPARFVEPAAQGGERQIRRPAAGRPTADAADDHEQAARGIDECGPR
jgi:hypothetical protein